MTFVFICHQIRKGARSPQTANLLKKGSMTKSLDKFKWLTLENLRHTSKTRTLIGTQIADDNNAPISIPEHVQPRPGKYKTRSCHYTISSNHTLILTSTETAFFFFFRRILELNFISSSTINSPSVDCFKRTIVSSN